MTYQRFYIPWSLFLVLVFCIGIFTVNHLVRAEDLSTKINNMKVTVNTYSTNITNAQARLGAKQRKMGALHSKWESLTSSQQNDKLDLAGSIGDLSPAAFIIECLQIGISLDGQSSVTSNLESAIGSVISEIQNLNTLIERYNERLLSLRTAISNHNIGHSSPSEPNHSLPNAPIGGWFVDGDLPDFLCAGKCGTTFNLPSEATGQEPGKGHGEKCGEAEDYYEEAKRRSRRTLWYDPDVSGPTLQAIQTTLLARSVSDGCGVKYFTCQNADYHAEKTCGKWVWENNVRKERCGEDFRDCLWYKRDHRNAWWSASGNHSDTYEAGSVNSGLNDPYDPDGIYSGSNLITGDCNEHTITASEASNHQWGTAPCGDDTHVGYLCQINASDHERVYESCPSLHARYECDGTDHSLQASCSSTDSNGNACTVTNFYACDNHSHVYPTPPPPPPTPTLVTCSACNVPYDPNSTSAVNLHRVRTCRFSGCGQTWQRCQSSAPICNKPYRKRNGLSCSAE